MTAALLFILHSMKTQSCSSWALRFSSQQALLWSATLHSQSQRAAFALLLVLWPNACCSVFCLHRYVTIAGAVAHFYWSKGERDRMPRFPVGLALKNTIKCACLACVMSVRPLTCCRSNATCMITLYAWCMCMHDGESPEHCCESCCNRLSLLLMLQYVPSRDLCGTSAANSSE